MSEINPPFLSPNYMSFNKSPNDIFCDVDLIFEYANRKAMYDFLFVMTIVLFSLFVTVYKIFAVENKHDLDLHL